MLAKEAAQGSRTWVLDARFAEVDSEHFKVLERGCAQSDGLEWPAEVATKVRVRFVVGEDVDKRRDPCSPHLRRRSCLARETSPNSCFQSSTAHLTKSVASRYGSRGIRCNAAAPGLVLTPRLEHRYTTPGQLEVALATPRFEVENGTIVEHETAPEDERESVGDAHG